MAILTESEKPKAEQRKPPNKRAGNKEDDGNGRCGCADILISKASGGACVTYATLEPFFWEMRKDDGQRED